MKLASMSIGISKLTSYPNFLRDFAENCIRRFRPELPLGWHLQLHHFHDHIRVFPNSRIWATPKSNFPSANSTSFSFLVGTYFAEGSDESQFEISIGGQVRESWQRVLPWEEYLSERTVVEVRHKVSGKLLSRETVKPVCSELVSFVPFVSEDSYQCVHKGQCGDALAWNHQ